MIFRRAILLAYSVQVVGENFHSSHFGGSGATGCGRNSFSWKKGKRAVPAGTWNRICISKLCFVQAHERLRQYCLWPESEKSSKTRIKERVTELVELTGLKGFEHRYPHQLSGGQRQRVAFARALAPEPQLLLLDEPFAAIDAKIRQELRTWLRELIERVGITSIFVTHDQDEAIEVANEIMVINQGRLEQKGTPWDIYKKPGTPFVASFIGESTVIEQAGSLRGFEEAAGVGTRALIRPEYIDVGPSEEFTLLSATEEGIVKHLHFRGSEWMVEVQVGDHRLMTYRSLEKSTLEPGQQVRVLVHRAYLYNDQSSWMVENRLKEDPMPIII